MKPLEQQLVRCWPPEARAGVTTLVAVSGGADSVALARALAATRPDTGRLVLTHFNHRLRGEDSEADEMFFRAFAKQLNLPASIGRSEGLMEGDLADGGTGRSIEEPARAERYAYLQRAANEWGARYLAVAHTADDQVETVLHRIMRGTGIAGLAGIPRVRRLTEACTLIRPLLFATRRDVRGYLGELKQGHREDATNAVLKATRNRIRHDLLPRLEEYNPKVRQSLLGLAGLAGEAQQLIDSLVDVLVGELRERCALRATERGIELAVAPLAGEPRYLVRELLVQMWRGQGWPEQSMGYDEWQQMADMTLDKENAPRKRVFPGGVVCERTESAIVLRRDNG